MKMKYRMEGYVDGHKFVITGHGMEILSSKWFKIFVKHTV